MTMTQLLVKTGTSLGLENNQSKVLFGQKNQHNASHF